MPATKRRIVVLISGSGTNLQALIDVQNTAALPNAEIVLVLSNRKAAYGLTRAAQANPPIPTAYLALQPYLKQNPGKTREGYDAEVAKIVLRSKPDIVVLAGWMHILSERFLELLDGRKQVAEEGIESVTNPIAVINLHPALPGEFDGASAIERAYEAFQKGEITRSGAMVHRVVKDVDRGEPIVVREVPLTRGESIEDFEVRLHAVEHEIIVQATAKVLEELSLGQPASPNSTRRTWLSSALPHIVLAVEIVISAVCIMSSSLTSSLNTSDQAQTAASSFETQLALEPLHLELDESDSVPFSQSFGSLFEALGLNPHASLGSSRGGTGSIDLSYVIENYANIKDINPEWSTDDIEEVMVMSRRRTLATIEEDMENSFRNPSPVSISDFSIESYPCPRHQDAKVKLCIRRDTGKKYVIKCKRISSPNMKWDEKAILQEISKRSDPFLPFLRWTFHRKEYMYIIMDTYPNSLVDIIHRYGSFASHHALFYASEILSAISFLHTARIIHRDLHADNVMIDESGHVVVCNFEQAVLMGSSEQHCTAKPRIKEHTAPELLLGWSHDYAVDCWGFGILLYYMYFGQYPYSLQEGFLDSSMLYGQIVDAAIPAESLRLIHPMARELIMKCLERNPAVRSTLEKIKQHPYFAQIDWQEVISKKIEVPYFIPLTSEIEQQSFNDTPKKRLSMNASLFSNDYNISHEFNTFRQPLMPPIEVVPKPLRNKILPSIPESCEGTPRVSIPPAIIEEEEPEPPSAQGTMGHHRPSPKIEVAPEITLEERLSQVWATIDKEAASISSVEFGECANKIPSRPSKLRKYRSSIQPRLFNLSTTSFQGKIWKKTRSTGTLRVPPPVDPIPDLPTGIHQIGSGIGFSYALPEAAPTQVSVASFVPTACHGMFPSGFSVSQLGFGLGHALRKAKEKAEVANAESNKGPIQEFGELEGSDVGTGTFIRDIYATPSWILSPPDGVHDPLPMNDAASCAEADLVPETPATLVDHHEDADAGPVNMNITIRKDLSKEFPGGTPGVTLRLVPSSGGLRQSFTDQENNRF